MLRPFSIFLCLLLILLAAFSACQQDDSAISKIVIYATPGKVVRLFDPSQPAEKISIVKRDERYFLTIQINIARKNLEKLYRKDIEISKKEWNALSSLIIEKKLLTWIPKPFKKRPPFHATTYGFHLAGNTWSIEKKWQAPLENQANPFVLMKKLSDFARNSSQTTSLKYLSSF
jgi:hypothetical protein